MWWVFAGTISCLLLVLYVPILQTLFGFGVVPITDLLICAVAVALSIVWFECFKYWNARKAQLR